jgi:hypothetical protein
VECVDPALVVEIGTFRLSSAGADVISQLCSVCGNTVKSLEVLAGQARLRVRKITYDSAEFQFWGSEQYRAGIALTEIRSLMVSRRRSMFPGEQIADFQSRSAALNAACEGDSASFYLEAMGSNN